MLRRHGMVMHGLILRLEHRGVKSSRKLSKAMASAEDNVPCEPQACPQMCRPFSRRVIAWALNMVPNLLLGYRA